MAELSTVTNTDIAPAPERASTTALILDSQSMDAAMRVAELMATSTVTVPKHLQGQPGDCLAITMQAMSWGMSPFVVAQKTHLVNGTLGYESQLVNAVVSSQGFIKGRFKYEYNGNGNQMQCRVGAVLAGEEAITWGEWLCVSDVKVKNSPLWQTNPKQQLGYLQIKNWARLYTPDAILGVYTKDELEDSTPRNITPVAASEPESTEPKYYSEAEFLANVEAWEKGYKKAAEKSPDNTPDSFIDFIQQKGKLFTDDQKKIILQWAPIEGESQEVEPPPAATEQPEVSDEEFIEKMNNA